ncbi:hypothetical protein J0A67_04800 [Algoriphagus aestuariicola]|uniref:YhhN-like protein n=1 Tax=Algoriphagus aestuariicola TaxID=1852016 RepID=A0ABS3BMC0_9BACT|nr:hypothetical protein [Algoriphagus aestuariicola]MBN7800167.1 hypothetical protein [Algoriphagus aestuariicola]
MVTIQEISSFAILIPLAIAGAKLKTGDLKLRLFFLFLLFGALVDGIGFAAYKTNSVWRIHGYLLVVYLVYEAYFFLWLTSSNLQSGIRSSIRIRIGAAFLLCFLVKFYFDFIGVDLLYSSVIQMFILVTIAFLSGFSLLRMAEQHDDLLSYPWFWIVSGIFLYTFGTFFIDALLYSQIINKIWYTRNLINIIQYGFFVVGLLLIPSSK